MAISQIQKRYSHFIVSNYKNKEPKATSDGTSCASGVEQYVHTPPTILRFAKAKLKIETPDQGWSRSHNRWNHS